MTKTNPIHYLVTGVVSPLLALQAVATTWPQRPWPVKDSETSYVVPYHGAPQIIEATEWATASSTAALSFPLRDFPFERA
jgi:hypothetical protein